MMGGQTPAAERAELYQAMAETLAEPPDWLARPGRQWPLYTHVQTLAPVSAAAAATLPALARIEAEPATARRVRYRTLFAGPGRPRFWLHESLHRSGRLPGPETFAVGQLYRVAGLQINGGELPDHASLELAFLGYLARRETVDAGRARAWQRLARQFIRKHAGAWLPALGRALVASGDPVYAPVGQLLAAWLREEAGQRPARKSAKKVRRLPHVQEADCTLCGFCVQACPTKALYIAEDARQTSLTLAAGRCSGCGRCVAVCESEAVTLDRVTALPGGDGARALLRSPRVICRGCGRPTVSRAELNFVAARLGRPPWLEYCLPCRAELMEKRDGFSAAIPPV